MDENIIPIGISKSGCDAILHKLLEMPKSVDRIFIYLNYYFDIELNIKNDILTFKYLLKLIDKVTHITDLLLLDEEYKNKKILVFTEFTSTAQYLSDHLLFRVIFKPIRNGYKNFSSFPHIS